MGNAYDFWEGHQTVLDFPHLKIHEGVGFFAVASAALTASQVVDMLIVTPDNDEWVNMTFDFQSALLTTFALYEASTFTYVTANDITAFNRNRNSDNTTGLLLCSAPGGSGEGTPLEIVVTGGVSSNGRANAAGGLTSRGEIILKRNTSYLVRVVSGAASNTYALVADWYEHEFAI